MLPRRFGRLIASAILFGAVVCATPITSAQTEQSAGEETDEPYINVFLNSDGAGEIETTLEENSAEAKLITKAFAETLGCALTVRKRGAGTVSLCGLAGRRQWPLRRIVDLNLGPIRDAAKASGFSSLWIVAAMAQSGFARRSGGGYAPQTAAGSAIFAWHVETGKSEPANLKFEYGYDWIDLARIFSPLLAIPLLLIALTLWMRRYALRLAATDAEAAWFSYARFMKLSMQAGWLTWLGMLSIPSIDGWVRFVSSAPDSLGRIGTQALIWAVMGVIPMAATSIVCRTLSYPVFAQVHGSQWTRGEIFRQAFWTQATLAVPLLCFVATIRLMAGDNFRGVVFFVLLGFAALLFGIRKIAAAAGRTPEWLSTGELRDRVFELAAKAGVKLKSLYVLSTAKSRLANAFAARGNTVMLTDYLLKHLTKREVDAIVAHELTHLKRKHLAVRAVIFGTVLYLSIAIAGQWMRLGQVPLLLAIVFVAFYFVARINEWTADAGAVKITGDPEAMITGLVKVTRLNKLPIRWSKWNEWLMTHPSTMRRAEVIAKKSGIAPERLAEILRDGTTGEEHYALPAALGGEGKVFSTRQKRSQMMRRSWTYTAIFTIVPAACLALAYALQWDWLEMFAVWIGALLLTFAIYLVAINFASVWGNAELEEQLRARLMRDGTMAREDGGICVSLAPDELPRLYDGNFAWDIGLLFAGHEQIVYAGEEVRFGLRREEIIDVCVVRGNPSWIRTCAVKLQWSDAATSRSGTFLLRPIKAKSLTEQRGIAEALATRLRDWKEGRLEQFDESPAGEFSTPVIGAVTSVDLRTPGGSQAISRSVLMLGYMSAAVAILFGLPFMDGIGGWYAVIATTVLGLLQYVPLWRYRQSAPPMARRGEIPAVPPAR